MKPKTVLLMNRVKLLIAFPILLADILTVLACIINGSYEFAFMFLILGWITFDYIKISRAETRKDKWYEAKETD